MKPIIRVPFLFLLALLLQSCATFTPRWIGCKSINQRSVEDPDRRVAGRGFSVLPPSGANWCVVPTDDSYVTFTTTPFIGQYVEKPPTMEQARHTYVSAAINIRVKKSDISSQAALKTFMERWLESGAAVRRIGNETYVDWTENPTDDTLDFYVELENSFKADCVRYRRESEETVNPRAPGWTLVTTGEGIACRHPSSNRMFVMVDFSERRRKGYDDPDATGRLREQADVMLRSLELTPLANPDEAVPAFQGAESDVNLEQLAKLKDSASQGDPKAQYQLSYYMFDKDRSQSVTWLCRAAMQRLYDAQIALGQFYEFGIVPVEQNYVKALMWYLLGSPARRQPAYSLKKEMTPSEIAQAEQMARDWKPGGCSNAELELGSPGQT